MAEFHVVAIDADAIGWPYQLVVTWEEDGFIRFFRAYIDDDELTELLMDIDRVR